MLVGLPPSVLAELSLANAITESPLIQREGFVKKEGVFMQFQKLMDAGLSVSHPVPKFSLTLCRGPLTDIIKHRSPRRKSGVRYVRNFVSAMLFFMLTNLPEISKVHRREENLDDRKEVDGKKLREDKFLGVSVVIPV